MSYLDGLARMMVTAPPGTWVAIDEERQRIIGHAASFTEIAQLAQRWGVPNALILWNAPKGPDLAQGTD